MPSCARVADKFAYFFSLVMMNSFFDDLEDEPLSIDNPVDWYYDDVAEHGYATKCCFTVFREYLEGHKLSVKVFGVDFDGLSPKVESDGLILDLIETDVDRGYAHIGLRVGECVDAQCSFGVSFNCDFCFCFFETGDDGAVSETDYYDDYCMK